MSETRLRNYVLDNVDHIGHWSKVESPDTSPGIPDLNWQMDKSGDWLELKFGNKRKPPHLRPTQCAWFRRRVRAGGKPQLLVCVDLDGVKTFGLIHGKDVPAMVNAKNNAHWLKACYIRWENRIVWTEFIDLLLRG
jgi:hypothetical protein